MIRVIRRSAERKKRLRPPDEEPPTSPSVQPEAEDPDEDDSPPAKKLLKNLLVQEVDRALNDLNNETPVYLRSKHRAASLIPEFDPDSEECTVTSWLKKIEQLGDIHDWDEKTMSFHLQDKLRGQARKWYNRLEDYNYSWTEWKNMLLRAFPKHRDFASMLEEMINRKKLASESMTKYYQEKIAMCFRCKLSDQASVSCIIRGLPPSLQSNARAFQCERPDELYEGFLSAFDDYRAPVPDLRGSIKDGPRQISEKRPMSINPDIDPCPRCKKTGHMVRFCPLPDQRTCYKCGNQGHIAPKCPGASKPSISTSNDVIKEIKLIQNYNEIYKKTVKVNGIFVKGYLDTGSQVNVLSTQVADVLNLSVTKTNVQLKGFSGGIITSRGEVEFKLEIDGLQIDCKAYLSDMDMDGVNLLIGQPVINNEGFSLIVHNGTATLKQDCNFLSRVEAEENSRFKVVTADKERLPRGISIVKVHILGNKEGNDVITPARHFELGAKSYSLPASVLRGSQGYMKIINVGSEEITWQPGEVLVRAEDCEQTSLDHQDRQVSPKAIISLQPVAKALFCNPIASSSISSIGGVAIDDIKIGPIGEHERNCLIDLLSRHTSCFASNTSELGCSDLVQMRIKLTSEQPVYRRPYRLSHPEQEIVNSKVKELLSAGIIKESESSYASPVILVKKRNGDSRLCVDYRALNFITVRDRYPLPNIDDQISKLAGKSYFTCLDMSQGYHQLKICPEDTHKTAFITTQGHFEYLRVPFGLANAPSVFMRLINKIVESIGNSSQSPNLESSELKSDSGPPEILAFLDDLLLPSHDVPSGLHLLNTVLQKFNDANLKLNMSKCSFLQKKITYLGHEISSEGIQPGELKLAAVDKFPIPCNVHEVRQFIGLCSYFRKFIFNFAVIARPLTELTKKNLDWVWNENHQNSFETLKSLLCSKPVLALYDRTLPTEIHTDACKLGIAGILLQRQTDGTLRPVMYFSRVTSREESVYHSYELETLAVVESLRRFRVYIVGMHVKIVTDCSAVRDTLTKRDIVPRVARWWMSIQDYDISIEYRPGDRMKHVDALSRNPIDVANVNRLEVADWFYLIQCQDEKLKHTIDLLNNGCTDSDIVNNYELVEGRLYRKTLDGKRLVVPGLARWRIVQMHHDEIGHVGFKRCLELIKKDYWFPKMTRFIRKYVASCLNCAYGKGEYGRKEGRLHPIPKPIEPMKMIHVDHLGPFCRTKKGYQYILVITDSFSKFVIAEPTRTVNSVETIRVLKKIFSLFGYPGRVVSDHGKAFTSRYFKRFSAQKQFRHTLNAIACPRANGQVERTNRTILDALRTTEGSETTNNWDNSLPDVVWGINNTMNATTNFTPYELMFTQTGRPVCDVSTPDRSNESVQSKRAKASARIKKASERMKRNYDKRRKNSTVYRKGDIVLWKQAPTSSAGKVNTKLDDLYSGPYIVSKVIGNDRYRIRSIKGIRGYKSFTALVASDSLRPYRSIAPMSDSASSTDEQLETEDLIDLLES